MTDYEQMARQVDDFADFLAAHFRAVRFVPAHCDVENVIAQYAILAQRHYGPTSKTTKRLTSRGMETYDQQND